MTLDQFAEVRSLSVGARNKLVGSPAVFMPSVLVTSRAWVAGATLEGITLAVAAEGGELSVTDDNTFIRTTIVNNGQTNFFGPGKPSATQQPSWSIPARR